MAIFRNDEDAIDASSAQEYRNLQPRGPHPDAGAKRSDFPCRPLPSGKISTEKPLLINSPCSAASVERPLHAAAMERMKNAATE